MRRIEEFDCSRCGASSGDSCTTDTGNRTSPHAPRKAAHALAAARLRESPLNAHCGRCSGLMPVTMVVVGDIARLHCLNKVGSGGECYTVVQEMPAKEGRTMARDAGLELFGKLGKIHDRCPRCKSGIVVPLLDGEGQVGGEKCDSCDATWPTEKVVYDAVLSDCRNYRYTLSRIWDEERPLVAFIMLNPSTANHEVDDPTIKRCMGFARSWEFGGIMVGNLFAFRTPSPKALAANGYHVGEHDDQYLRALIARCDEVVVGWGALKAKARPRALAVLEMIDSPKCLDTTKRGDPRHPLYVRGSTQLKPYQGAETAAGKVSP